MVKIQLGFGYVNQIYNADDFIGTKARVLVIVNSGQRWRGVLTDEQDAVGINIGNRVVKIPRSDIIFVGNPTKP